MSGGATASARICFIEIDFGCLALRSGRRFMLRIMAVIVVMLAAASPAFSQQPIPRTPDGKPDFHGHWTSQFATTFERMPGATTLVVGEAEANRLGEQVYQRWAERGAGLDPDVLAANVRNLMRVDGEYRTSLVVEPADGKIPLTEEARRLVDETRRKVPTLPDGPEARSEFERCISGHGRTPLTLTPTVNPRQIVQTATNLVIYSEDGADLRIIPFGGPGRNEAVPLWGGDSRGSWEGDTLVIETVNQRGKVRASVTAILVIRPEARVVERLKMPSADELLYSYTITDPVMYSAPLRVEFTLSRARTPTMEFGCHEGNYAMMNMLASARSAERRAAIGKPAKKR
jgi:hypothetical protein